LVSLDRSFGIVRLVEVVPEPGEWA